MSIAGQYRLAGVVILSGFLALSGDLWWAWQHAPYDVGGGWIALGWVGLVVGVVFGSANVAVQPALRWMLAALMLGLISLVGELNVARHAALVMVAVAWIPAWRIRWVVGLSGVAWWPALGWAMAQFLDGPWVIWVRAMVLVGGVAVALIIRRRRKNSINGAS